MNIVNITEKTTGSQWNYYRDGPNDPLSSNFESFKYKTSITGNAYNIDKKIADDNGNEVDNPEYDANKVGKMKLKLLFH